MHTAILFDCFGVFHPDPVFARMAISSKQTAEALHNLDIQAATGTITKSDFVRQSSKLLSITRQEAEDEFFVAHNYNVELRDFASNIRGKYKTGLISNIGADMMDGFFDQNELDTLFDIVIISGKVKVTKPDLAIFKLACKNLGIDTTEAIMVDDVEANVEAAKSLGMAGITYTIHTRL